MNFRDFVEAAKTHLTRQGWAVEGHNGVWPLYAKGATRPLPEALVFELWKDSAFDPVVESYLVESGWSRSGPGIIVGQQIFVRNDVYKTQRMALIEQLKIHRLDRAEVAPAPTPTTVKRVMDVSQFRNTPVSR